MTHPVKIIMAALLPTVAYTTDSQTTLTISVASSLTDVMSEISEQFESKHPDVKLEFNYGGSNWLVRQIIAGADIDVIITAGQMPINKLIEASLVDSEKVIPIAGNSMALVGRDGTNITFQSLDNANRIAIGQPGVPVGDYARQILQHYKLENTLNDRLVLAANARQVLTYVSTGDADVGLVYATDAAAGNVTILDTAQPESHSPIIYPAAALNRTPNRKTASAFIAFLTTPECQAIFVSNGFTPPPTNTATTPKNQNQPHTSAWQAMSLSIKAATAAMLFVIPIGTAIGWWLSRSKLFAKDLIDALIALPLVLPPTATGYFLILILGGDSWIGTRLQNWFGWRITLTLTAAAIAAAVIALPLMVLSAKAAFTQIDRKLEWTSMSLGATPWRTFRHITVPLAKHGLLAGIILSFARAIGEFGATFMLAGMIPGKTMTAPLAILHAFTNHDDQTAKTLVLTLSLFSIAVIVLANRLNARSRKTT